MLILEHFIGKGATRLCFHHPKAPDKCVKVAMRARNVPQLRHELDAALACQPTLGKYLPAYDDTLAHTNLGPGLVCELIKNDDGTLAPSLEDLRYSSGIPQCIVAQVENFIRIVLKHNIPLYDFNPANFVVQTINGEKILRLTDIKTYNDYKPWTYLHLEKKIPAVSRMIIRRRLKRLTEWVEHCPKAQIE